MKKELICIAAAMVLCFSACSVRQPSGTAGIPANPTTQPVSQTPASGTTAAPVLPTAQPTQPVTAVPTQPATQPTVTVPPTTAAPPATTLTVIQPEAVISETVTEIAKLMPDLRHDPALLVGTQIPMTVAISATHEEAVAELHDGLMEIFDYNLYLEQQQNPEQIQPVIFDYTYSLRYLGLNSDGSQHQFEVCYVINKQSYKDEFFDSDEVIRLVTQSVSESTMVSVTPFEDEEYTRIVVYDSIPYFYTTQNTVDRLVRAIENEIYGENLGYVKFTQFRLVFHSKGETNYAFLLYLR